MTAKLCLFSRAFHFKNYETRIFSDNFALKLLGKENYNLIEGYLLKGKDFFCPDFNGDGKDIIKKIVNEQLSPSVLGRSAFCEKSLINAVKIGSTQYLILGAGFDTFSLRQGDVFKNINIFELDLKETAKEKIRRINELNIKIPSNVTFINADLSRDDFTNQLINNTYFKEEKASFCSLLGVVYYLEQESFKNMLKNLSKILSSKSSLLFDYPDEFAFSPYAGKRAIKQALLASRANEKMFHGYSYFEMEKILEENGFLVYEHLNPKEITEQYFKEFNRAYPNEKMTAFDNTDYILAVKK